MQFFSNFDTSYLERLRAEDPDTQKHFITYFRELMRIKLRSRLSSEHIEDVQQGKHSPVSLLLCDPRKGFGSPSGWALS